MALAETTLTIESWRNDDLPIWQDKIIPAFESSTPTSRSKFPPTAPTEYNAALNAKLDGGTAGDLITCRPFDASLQLFKKGNLADLNDLPGMENFSDVAKCAWTTDDGKTTFCVPMASVIHGFIYNKDDLRQARLEAAEDRGRVLRRARQDQGGRHLHPDGDGHQRPVGSRDHGLPEYRPQLLEGRGRPHGADQGQGRSSPTRPMSSRVRSSPRWKPYLGDGFEAQTYPDSQNLFTLGRAAIYPAGSWEISPSTSRREFEMGAFPPPVRRPATPATSPTTPTSASA